MCRVPGAHSQEGGSIIPKNDCSISACLALRWVNSLLGKGCWTVGVAFDSGLWEAS
jgi:hypothetical protein